MSRPPTACDRGETLVELLLAVMIMGLCATALMGAVMTTTSASTLHQESTRSGILVRTWTERLAVAPYVPCAGRSSVTTPPEPSGWAGGPPTWTRTIEGSTYTAEVVSVEYGRSDGSGFGASCGPDAGLQRFVLRVSSPGLGFEGASEELAVITRNPCTSTSDPGCS